MDSAKWKRAIYHWGVKAGTRAIDAGRSSSLADLLLVRELGRHKKTTVWARSAGSPSSFIGILSIISFCSSGESLARRGVL
jgi:hypothetical protein